MPKKMKDNLNPIGTKYALYVRVSTNAQAEEGYSIEIQKERLKKYVESKGGSDMEFYVDDGYTGAALERPAMQRLIQDVKDDKIKCVVVVKLDRLSRSQKDTLYLIEDVFLTHDVSFMSLNENFETTTAFGRAMVGILSVFAQLERENIYERTRSGMQKRVESGLWMGGGRTPFGYDYDKRQGILVPNKDAARVKKIYEMYLEGYSFDSIADALNLKYGRLAEQILVRKSNAGYIVYNDVTYKGRHEPIIDLDTYNKAMTMYQERSSKRYTSSSVHLLTGLVYCGVCGAKMRYSPWGANRYKFVCYSQQTSKKYLIKDSNCDNDKLWADDIENIVITDIFAMSKKNMSEDVQPQEESASLITILTEQYDRLCSKLKNLYNLYATSEDETLLETINENKRDVEALKVKMDKELESQAATKIIADAKKRLKNIEQAWQYMTAKEKQIIVKSVVKSVRINHSDVTIEYKF